MTKDWLNNNGIDYLEKKVEHEDIAEELMGMGYKVTPVVMVDETAIVGYNPTKLSEVLL